MVITSSAYGNELYTVTSVHVCIDCYYVQLLYIETFYIEGMYKVCLMWDGTITGKLNKWWEAKIENYCLLYQ